MHFDRFGNGPHIFLGVHGWSGDHRTFAPIYKALPNAVSFYAVDLPGCGQSPAPRAWTLDAIVAELTEFVQSLAVPVTLIGNCSGANLLLFAAQRAPHRVRRLVLIDTFAEWPWYFRVFLNPVWGRYAYLTTFANPLGRWMTNLSLRGKRAQDTSLTRGFQNVDHRVTYRYLELLRNAGDIEQFEALKMPIDIAYGEKSFAAVRQSAERLGNLWPQATVTCLSGAGHLPIAEAVSQLRQLLFLALPKEPVCLTNSTPYVS